MRIVSFLFLPLLALTIAGCATVSASGKKSSSFNGEVHSALVVIDDYWLSKGDTSLSVWLPRNDSAVSTEIDTQIKYIAGRCMQRWQQIFDLNDISFKVVRKSIMQPSFSSNYNYVLVLKPTNVIYNHGINNFTFKSAMFEKGTADPIWQGAIEFTPAYTQKSGIDDSVDELAKGILVQLEKDRIITLPSPEIKVPEKKSSTPQS